jgi:hypothetical protein
MHRVGQLIVLNLVETNWFRGYIRITIHFSGGRRRRSVQHFPVHMALKATKANTRHLSVEALG